MTDDPAAMSRDDLLAELNRADATLASLRLNVRVHGGSAASLALLRAEVEWQARLAEEDAVEREFFLGKHEE